MTALIRGFKYFAKLPIKVKIKELRLTKDQQKSDRNDPDRMEIVTILGAGQLVKGTMTACKKIFNSKGKKYLSNRLGGTSAKFFPWYADRNSPNQDRTQKRLAKIAKYKQMNWTKKIVRITLDTVQYLNLPIEYKGDAVTLHQALTCCRSSRIANYPLTSSINYVQRTGDFVAVCHGD